MNKFNIPFQNKPHISYFRSMKWAFFVFSFIFQTTWANSTPSDSLPYTSYKNHFIYFNDIGFSAAPFTLKNQFHGVKRKLKFEHNLRPVLGVGMAWRWLSFRLGIGLPYTLRSKKKYGDANYFHLGLKFNFKRFHINVAVDNYHGYILTNRHNWDSNFSSKEFDKNFNINCVNLSISGWYFFDKRFNMNAFLGRRAFYHSEAKSWYVRPLLNIFGMDNKGKIIAPSILTDTSTERTLIHSLGVFELGIVPGYGYVNNFNNWQVGVFGGLGLVLQAKNYSTPNTGRTFVGFEPRADLRFNAGYVKEKFFILLDLKFDFKTTRFQELVFEQTYYNLKLVGGIRIKTKPKRKVK